jgi:hypothetical protein
MKWRRNSKGHAKDRRLGSLETKTGLQLRSSALCICEAISSRHTSSFYASYLLVLK